MIELTNIYIYIYIKLYNVYIYIYVYISRPLQLPKSIQLEDDRTNVDDVSPCGGRPEPNSSGVVVIQVTVGHGACDTPLLAFLGPPRPIEGPSRELVCKCWVLVVHESLPNFQPYNVQCDC